MTHEEFTGVTFNDLESLTHSEPGCQSHRCCPSSIAQKSR